MRNLVGPQSSFLGYLLNCAFARQRGGADAGQRSIWGKVRGLNLPSDSGFGVLASFIVISWLGAFTGESNKRSFGVIRELFSNKAGGLPCTGCRWAQLTGLIEL